MELVSWRLILVRMGKRERQGNAQGR
jgi:hypothetical protein